MSVFKPFNVLVPKAEFEQLWPVIACDQFTSQPEYWRRLREKIGGAPSSIHCIIPEAELSSATDQTYAAIRDTMKSYIDKEIFREYQNSFVYVERTLMNGEVRAGIVGVIDLEAYDYHNDSKAPIRATERTVIERIPPRLKIRKEALLELSHVLLLCDDERMSVIEPLRSEVKTKLYEMDLLQGGGHVTGWLVDGDAATRLQDRLEAYCRRKLAESDDLLFAVGDGNHSLAAAKAYYEDLKTTIKTSCAADGADSSAAAGDSCAAPGAKSTDREALDRARYAMVELENIYSPVQKLEPIHRLLTGVDVDHVLAFLKENCCVEGGYPVKWVAGDHEGIIYLDVSSSEHAANDVEHADNNSEHAGGRRKNGEPPVYVLQNALDEFLEGGAGRGADRDGHNKCAGSHNKGAGGVTKGELDYIHGEGALRKLAKQENTIGFILQGISKYNLFNAIAEDGAFPRKSFSMGEAKEKRYYIESRRL